MENFEKLSISPTPAFMEGVAGVTPVLDAHLKNEVLQKVCKVTGWEGAGFPGSMLAPMTRENMPLLSQEKYFVSRKLDGTRFMMLIDGFQKVYFINRNGDVFHTLNVSFPALLPTGTIGKTSSELKYLCNTVLDGEMIFTTKDDGTAKETPTYYIFDTLSMGDEILSHLTFSERISYTNEITSARLEAIFVGVVDPNFEPFCVKSVDFHPLKKIEKVLSSPLPCKCDGLVFTPDQRPYNCWLSTPGVNDFALKWKPPTENTVDFELQLGNPGETEMGFLLVKGCEEPWGSIKLTPVLQPLDGKIVECYRQEGQWKLLRQRSDRNSPNSLETACATLKSINDGISQEEFIRFVKENCPEN